MTQREILVEVREVKIYYTISLKMQLYYLMKMKSKRVAIIPVAIPKEQSLRKLFEGIFICLIIGYGSLRVSVRIISIWWVFMSAFIWRESVRFRVNSFSVQELSDRVVSIFVLPDVVTEMVLYMTFVLYLTLSLPRTKIVSPGADKRLI